MYRTWLEEERRLHGFAGAQFSTVQGKHIPMFGTQVEYFIHWSVSSVVLLDALARAGSNSARVFDRSSMVMALTQRETMDVVGEIGPKVVPFGNLRPYLSLLANWTTAEQSDAPQAQVVLAAILCFYRG